MTARDIVMSAAGGTTDKTYIEDVFSTYLYTGNAGSITVNNGIDLAGKGGMVWVKCRTNNTTENHGIWDTVRGAGTGANTNKALSTSSTAAEGLGATAHWVGPFSNSGFTVRNASAAVSPYQLTNVAGIDYASWTFRKAPKFFDVVTYTGDGVAGKTISHNLGQAPGMIIVKCTSTTSNWTVYHKGANDGVTPENYALTFNGTGPQGTTSAWNNTAPTASAFTLGIASAVNTSGGTYVAYLFAHDTTTDGLIQCGSYTGNGSTTGPSVSLGWEPQYLMIKRSSSGTGNWQILDNMRGMPVDSAEATLQANLSNAESSVDYVSPTADGFQITSANTEVNVSGVTYIYMAIRRGPMRTPTDGTKVFNTVARTGTGSNATVSTGIVTDAVIEGNRTLTTAGTKFGAWNRLRGTSYLITNTTAAEVAAGTTIIQTKPWDVMDGYKVGTTSTLTNASSNTFVNWAFRRAPGFFDVVCYSGVTSAQTIKHNLGVIPELVIIKNRTSTWDWPVFSTLFANPTTDRLVLNTTASIITAGSPAFSTPTKTTFGFEDWGDSYNVGGNNYVAHLFASCPGVSKVGTYTGNGSSQTINCGFTTGARFVLIKRTDNTGDWYVWDTARGIVANNDPHLSLNTTAAEVTSDDSVDANTSGFIVNQVTATNVNVNAATYFYLAIA